ncbi:MAG: class B sortase [Oscillospiraceae bacterium]|jgi:sortase B
MKKLSRIRALIFCLVLPVFLFSAYRIYQYWDEGHISQQFTETLVNQAVYNPTSAEDIPITVDFDSLQRKYADVVAWLYCEDTPINYPIAQADDNTYYLRRLLDGTENQSGTLFMDSRNQAEFSDWNTVIYGHNMKNGTMFGTLPDYCNQAYYDAYPILYLFTPQQTYCVELIAGYVTASTSEAYSIPQSQEERDRLLDDARERSTFVSSATIEPDNRVITLSTCSYEYDDARYVLIGVLHTFNT